MTTSEPALLDTNVPVNALFEQSEHFAASRSLLDRAKDQAAGFRLLPQNVAEFYAVVTNPKRVTAPKAATEALSAIRAFLALPGIALLPVPTDVISRLLTLLERRPVTRGKVHDIHLVASMLGNGVVRIYTYNRDDFTPFSELEVLTPSLGEPEPSPEK